MKFEFPCATTMSVCVNDCNWEKRADPYLNISVSGNRKLISASFSKTATSLAWEKHADR